MPIDSWSRCIRLTLGTATHETGHVLTMYHCIYNRCCMNGSNSLEEALKSPLWLCPICLRKICWNLQVEPVSYLERQHAFCAKHKLEEEAAHYRRAIELLEK